MREVYKLLGGKHELELVKADVNEKAPFYASVRFRQLVEGSKFHIDADVEAQVDLRTGAPIDLAIPDIPPLRPPSRQIISEDQAKGAAAEAVYRHLGWADIEVLFHPPQYMIPALAGYANELAPEDIELARTGTAKVIYFGTIRQPRPWGRSQAPTDAWCLVWVDAESGRTLALAPSSKHLLGAQPSPDPAKPFSWEGEWRCGRGGGTLTPTVLGAFGHGREVILQRGSEVLTALYDADSGLLQITVGGAKHLARPSKELQRALEKAPGITARPFGAAKAP